VTLRVASSVSKKASQSAKVAFAERFEVGHAPATRDERHGAGDLAVVHVRAKRVAETFEALGGEADRAGRRGP
jgi:hypothetical protein